MKKILALILSVLTLTFVMTGCGDAGAPNPKNGTKATNSGFTDLMGNWKQVDGSSDTSYQVAVITADTITVYWVLDDSQSLYWEGSFTAPTAETEPYKWVSTNDHDKTDLAMLASSDDTKEFTYKDGQVTYSVSAMGTTKTIKLKKTTENVVQEEAEGITAKPSIKEYSTGQTWTVDGQWSLTVDSIAETTERNEFSDKTPAAVYIVSYTYKNIGYADESGFMDGLYFSLDDKIVDNAGFMGYSYPGNVTSDPQETPIGASCTAQACIGVDNAGAVKLYVTKYDGTGAKQEATFTVTP